MKISVCLIYINSDITAIYSIFAFAALTLLNKNRYTANFNICYLFFFVWMMS